MPDLFAIFSDSDVMRYWDGALMTSITDAEAYLRQIDENFLRRQLFQWGIALSATKGSALSLKAIGCVLADNLSPQKARILLMLALGPSRDSEVLQKYFDR